MLMCEVYKYGEVPEQIDLDEIKKQKNWFLTKDKPKSVKDISVEIERNFLSLLSYLELSEDISIIMFYSKLYYLKQKNEREIASLNNN